MYYRWIKTKIMHAFVFLLWSRLFNFVLITILNKLFKSYFITVFNFARWKALKEPHVASREAVEESY